MSLSIRAFLATPLPDEVRTQTLELCRQLAGELPEVRWNRAETLHLTLKFFPAIEEESLEKIGEVMLSVGRLTTPFQVRIKGMGAFPDLNRPRVFWLGIEQDRPLRQLHQELDGQLERIGIARDDDRPFAPHLTLGRARGVLRAAGAILGPRQPGLDLELPVNQLILYQSRLLPSGAQHLPRRVVRFQGRSTQ
ncbi:MAG: RNA 2',3'-cyclic phosphodiesterase [Trichloromonadaceae bacterium]